MNPLVKCANGCDAAPSPPSLVICRACMDKIGLRLRRWANGERSDADYGPLVDERLSPSDGEKGTPR